METVLITGASGGLGLELAQLFARDGNRLILVARSGEMLAGVARDLERRFGISARVLVKDLAEREAAAEICGELERDGVTVDVLVNNAGFGTYGLFKEIPLESQLELLQVNIAALTALTRLFLPGMVARKRGKIMNVASTAAFQPGPRMAVYFASKAYVLFLSEALDCELYGTGVRVSAFCPGPTRTGFQKRARNEAIRQSSFYMMEAGPAASIGYRDFLKGKAIIIPGLLNKALAFAVRLVPRGWVMAVVRFLYEQKDRGRGQN